MSKKNKVRRVRTQRKPTNPHFISITQEILEQMNWRERQRFFNKRVEMWRRA